jgi:hypothetical protein
MVYDFYKSYTIDGGKIFVFDVHCSLCFPLFIIDLLPSFSQKIKLPLVVDRK